MLSQPKALHIARCKNLSPSVSFNQRSPWFFPWQYEVIKWYRWWCAFFLAITRKAHHYGNHMLWELLGSAVSHSTLCTDTYNTHTPLQDPCQLGLRYFVSRTESTFCFHQSNVPQSNACFIFLYEEIAIMSLYRSSKGNVVNGIGIKPGPCIEHFGH